MSHLSCWKFNPELFLINENIIKFKSETDANFIPDSIFAFHLVLLSALLFSFTVEINLCIDFYLISKQANAHTYLTHQKDSTFSNTTNWNNHINFWTCSDFVGQKFIGHICVLFLYSIQSSCHERCETIGNGQHKTELIKCRMKMGREMEKKRWNTTKFYCQVYLLANCFHIQASSNWWFESYAAEIVRMALDSK